MIRELLVPVLAVVAWLGLARRPAQPVPVTYLAPADARFGERFRARSMNRVLEPPHSIQELNDGRVLIKADRRLLIGDPRTGAVSPLPDSIGGLVALEGDSSLLVGRDEWRVLLSGKAIGVLSLNNAIVRYMRENVLNAAGADGQGNFYTELAGRQPTDSHSVLQIDRRSGERRVIASLFFPGLPRGGVCLNLERAAYFADGWIAVLRANPYRVDWRSPAAEWVRGPPIPAPSLPFTDAERTAYLSWISRDRQSYPGMNTTEFEWPANLCAWHSGYLPLPMPDGRVLVYRVPSAGIPGTRYDVINRRGERERQIVMAQDQAIIGFGKRSVYVRTIDGTTSTISRHPVNW